MSYRAGIILLQGKQVALIDRHRSGRHYLVFPGGHVDEGESPRQAAVREAQEELGLQVRLVREVARFKWQGKWQHYYLAEITGGSFGTGQGEEMLDPHPESGSYQPVWMPVASLLDQPVLPRPLAQLVLEASRSGWPEQVVVIQEESS
jgi:8-oxo-dGTP diphosphatase